MHKGCFCDRTFHEDKNVSVAEEELTTLRAQLAMLTVKTLQAQLTLLRAELNARRMFEDEAEDSNWNEAYESWCIEIEKCTAATDAAGALRGEGDGN